MGWFGADRGEKRIFGSRAGLPAMTLALSIVCLALFLALAALPPLHQRIVVEAAGVNPKEIALWLGTVGEGWRPEGGRSLVTALFVHVSGLHLFGNLAYLWVFGIPVERRMGALFLATVFLVGGSVAYLILAQRLSQLDATVIGASGAVSAVLGACLGLFPGRRIGLYLPLGLVVQSVRLPALLVIGSWFALQLLYSVIGPISGIMAWWIHLTGFALGLMFALLARATRNFMPGRD